MIRRDRMNGGEETVLTSISTSTTREEIDLISSSSTRIEVQASLCLEIGQKIGHMLVEFYVAYQSTDDEHHSFLVDVFSAGDNIPTLAIAAIAFGDLDRSEICAEVSR